jgi:hypothetical protein
MRPTGAANAASLHPRRDKAVDKAGCATAPWRARSARFTHRHPIRPSRTRPSSQFTEAQIQPGLTDPAKPNMITPIRVTQDARWPTSNRNPGRLQIGIGGRLPIGMRGRLRRNPQPGQPTACFARWSMRGCARTRRRATFGASDGEGFGRHRASHGPKAGHPAASFWMYVGPRQKEKGPAVSHSAGPSHGYQARLLAIRTRGIECTRRNERAVQYGTVGLDKRAKTKRAAGCVIRAAAVVQRLWSGQHPPRQCARPLARG